MRKEERGELEKWRPVPQQRWKMLQQNHPELLMHLLSYPSSEKLKHKTRSYYAE
jgi:hypothetical protein